MFHILGLRNFVIKKTNNCFAVENKNGMKSEVVMIQPKTSLTGSFVKMLPLGLLYASYKIVNRGFKVHILDVRVNPSSWETNLEELINDRTLVIGLTIMSGISITEGIKISRYIKDRWPRLNVVWGGPHPTFSPNDVMQEQSVDFVIRGYGAESFYQLILNLTGDEELMPLNKIKGLIWKGSEEAVHINDTSNSFEFIHYKEIPYHLIKDYSVYRHIDSNERVFSMYSVMGCPYKCTFCSSPTQYAGIKKKWDSYPIQEIIEHIKMLKEEYGATFIYFIDDDSFVDLKHVENIIDEINRIGIRIKLGFRGARVNEVARMSDDFLEKLEDAGTNTMHIGLESGSNRLLKMTKKNTTVDQIIEINKKLARHTKIKTFYNFIVGFPTETIEETKMTRDLILRLISDNPLCCVIPLNKPRPLPGTELFDLAVQHGYKTPETLIDWGKYDVESSDYNPVWLTEKHNKFIRMMFLCMYFIDDKIFKVVEDEGLRLKLFRVLAVLYKPVALFRFRRGFYRFLIEDKVYTFLNHLLSEKA